jgi:hypothetical protein
MSLDYQYQSLDIKNTGSTVYVPNNNLAKLMYYIKCATSVIQYDLDDRIINYKNYKLLSAEEEKLVVDLAKILEPDFLIQYNIFLVGDNYLTAEAADNEFFEVTNNQFGLHVSSEIMVAGVARKVNKIMVCRKCWIQENYYDPMDYYNTKSKDCCYKFCKFLDCFAGCFDTCCSCCDSDHSCSKTCKKVCCLIIWGIIIANIIIPTIINIKRKK